MPLPAAEAIKLVQPASVKSHSWLPLLAYTKTEKRYSREERKTKLKPRPIMYASHKDACILSKYASEVSNRLERIYKDEDLGSHVIAYRKLGRSNYHFAADAYKFALDHTPCVILCFDVSGFFDSLDHRLLKSYLEDLLGVYELTDDWHRVFRHVTRYCRTERSDIRGASGTRSEDGQFKTCSPCNWWPVATDRDNC